MQDLKTINSRSKVTRTAENPELTASTKEVQTGPLRQAYFGRQHAQAEVDQTCGRQARPNLGEAKADHGLGDGKNAKLGEAHADQKGNLDIPKVKSVSNATRAGKLVGGVSGSNEAISIKSKLNFEQKSKVKIKGNKEIEKNGKKKLECLGMNGNERMVCSMTPKNDPPAKVNEKKIIKGDQKNMQQKKSTQFNSRQKIKKMFEVTKKIYAYPLKKSSRKKKLPAEAKVDLVKDEKKK